MISPCFPMIFHEMLNISIQIYVLGPSHFLSSPPGKLSCWPGARFGAQFAPHFMWGGLQITTATRGFNKHGEFTVSTNMKSSVALNLVLSKPTFMVCHGVSMSWFLRTNRQKIGQSPRDASGPSHAAWPSGDEAVQPNPQSTRFKNVATMAHDTGSG